MVDNRYYLQALANALGRTLIPMYDVLMPAQGAGMNAQNLVSPGITSAMRNQAGLDTIRNTQALRNAFETGMSAANNNVLASLGAMQPNASLATRGYPSSYDRNSVNLTDRGFPSSRDRSMARPMPVAYTYNPGRKGGQNNGR